MAQYYHKKKNPTSKTLVKTCLVLVFILAAMLAILFSLPENDTPANINKEITVEAGAQSIDPNAFLIVPDPRTSCHLDTRLARLNFKCSTKENINIL